jgi:type VI secretion system protein ImpG
VLTDYYKQELRVIKDIAADFARDNPSLSKSLSGATADPDASRILEGVAFLTANIRQELDSQFPKLLHSLAQLVCPQYIRPMPSATIIAFEPKPSIAKELKIKAGTYVDSKETAEGSCRFKTTESIDLLPLKLTSVSQLDQNGNSGVVINLGFTLINQTLDQLPFNKIRLFLGGEYSDASDLYSLLFNQLQQIKVVANGESYLNKSDISPTGFDKSQSLFPQPKGMMPAFDLIQQYFLFPQKFLFIDLDLTNWVSRGAGDKFEIQFICDKPNFRMPKITREHFVLHASPAVNLFDLESQSILINAQHSEYQLLPNKGSDGGEIQIYSVDHVESHARGMQESRQYILFGGFTKPDGNTSVYELNYQQGSTSYAPDTFIKLAFGQEQQINKNEILKAQLTCSNGQAAEKLSPGDICVATGNTPELTTFRNVTTPTKARKIPLDGDMLWQLISHLSLNYLSITDSDTLKAILRQYIAPDDRHKSDKLVNEKKIESIDKLEVVAGESLFANNFIHGQNIKIIIKSENFECIGDKYLFGSVLDRFLSGTTTINVYTELTFEDYFSGERQLWPAKIGNRPLQ